MRSIAFVIIGLCFMMATVRSSTGSSIKKRAAACLDYFPCHCQDSKPTTEGVLVDCDQVPISTIQEYFSKLGALNIELQFTSFKLTIAPSETSSIPANLLGTSSTSRLSITCMGSSYQLAIDKNAFRSSKLSAKGVSIRDCDLGKQPDFAFLSGFQSLISLTIHNSKNFNSFEGVPSQSQFEQVAIWNSRGFENLKDCPQIALPSLKQFYLIGNELDDETTAKLLETFAQASVGTLEELKIDQNKLTRIPDLVKSFSKLNELRLENNAIKNINAKSLALSGFVGFLHLGENTLSSFEPDAFGEGNYKIVDLKRNNVVRLDSNVFQSMLEKMFDFSSTQGVGSAALQLFQNPIECDCHLTWLIVHKRNLLSVIEGAHCSNSTPLENLNPEDFRDCPV